MHVHTEHTREGRAGHRLAVAAVPVPRVRRRAAGAATGSSTEATVVVGRRSAASCARGDDVVVGNPEFSVGPVPSGRRVIIRPVCAPLGIEVFIFFTAAPLRPGRSKARA
ncbi:hypothetical protein [Streptomyces sp. NPDC058595]|uniref:hypothetical protein n=1 Tax=Streptomyces sp. NPDC058595 TaxID=3346550 RepID=UPI0036513FCD